MELRHGPLRAVGGERQLLGGHIERAEPVARQAEGLLEFIARAESLRPARCAVGKDGDREDDTVALRIAPEPGAGRVEHLVVDGNALKLTHAVGEDRERAGRRVRQHHLGLRRLVVGLGIGAAGEAARGDIEGTVVTDSEPPRLLDAGHERRARSVRLQTDDARRALLDDEQAVVEVEGEADGALQAGGHDRARTVRSDAPHGPGRTVGDEHVARGVDDDATKIDEAVGERFEGRQRRDRLFGRRAGRQTGKRQDHDAEDARYHLYGARRMRSISARFSGRAPSTVVACCGTPSVSTIRSQR